MGFFRQFPKTSYDFFNRGVNYKVTDIFRYVNVDYSFLDDVSTYSYYRIQNGERPDVVSQRLYGTPDYYWTFFIINDHLKEGIGNWPLPPELFEDYMNSEYSGVAVTSEVNLGINQEGEILYTNTLADEFPIGTEVAITVAGVPTVITDPQTGAQKIIPTYVTRGTGKVYARNPQLCQLVIRDIVPSPGVTEPFVEEGFIRSNNDTLVIKSFSLYRDAVKYYVESTASVSVSGAAIAKVTTSGGSLPLVTNRAILTGGTSGATGKIYSSVSTPGNYTLYSISGTFIPGEAITGSGASSCILSSIALGASDKVTSTGDVFSDIDNQTELELRESYNPYAFDPTELSSEANFSIEPVSYYDYESDLNERRSNIRVVRPNLIYRFANQFSNLINAN
jgi:hypothetical protein